MASPSESKITCSHCHTTYSPAQAFCALCGIPCPFIEIDHFNRLTLPSTPLLTEETVEKAYFLHQQQLHPDRFVHASPTLQAYAMAHSAALNEAYYVLKKPIQRLCYLLSLKGYPVLDAKPDPGLMLDMLERQETLSSTKLLEDIQALAEKTKQTIATCYENALQEYAQGNLQKAAKEALALHYLDKYCSDIEGALSNHV